MAMSPAPNSPSPSIAIVGIACRFPGANDLEEYWQNIKAGTDAITEIPSTHWSMAEYFDADPKSPDMTYGRKGGFLSPIDFDPLEFGISPNALEATDTSQLLALLAARDALVDAGYGAGAKAFDRERVSVILGVTGTLELVVPLGARLGHPIWRRALAEAGVDPETADDVVERIRDSYVGWQEASFPGLLGNVVAGRIANRLDLGGTNCVVDAACASSLSALHLAALELAAGRSDLVLTGGVDTFNDIFMYMCFSKTPALSPTGDARPFAADGDGTTLGEGVGILALKRLDDAVRDGDRVYAVLKGVGSASDGRGNAIYAPDSDGQAKAIRRAYEIAGVTPDTIELVEAHGTGTAVGDATEARGLRSVYDSSDRARPWCAIGSVKSQIGHTKAAAGVAGLIKATLALHHKVLPPTIKVDRPVAELGAESEAPFYLGDAARPWLSRPDHPRRAAISSFGFGGSNFHCVLEEAQAEKAAPDWTGEVQIVALCGADSSALRDALAPWQKGREWSWSELRDRAAATRRDFDPTAPARLVFVVHRTDTNLAATVRNLRAMLESRGDGEGWTTPDGATCAYGTPRGKLAFLFPGQGAQYVGMGRDLVCHFPESLTSLAHADEAFWRDRDEPRRRPLSDLMYPRPRRTPDERAEQEKTLRATDHAQPALGAHEVSLLHVLGRFGVEADAFAGHSYGELTALHAAGVFSEKNLHQLSNFRGRLMASGSGDRGSMLAVPKSAEFVERWLAEQSVDLTIANHNTPTQTILSGRTSEITRAAERFEKSGVRTRRLEVSAAFHSPLVAGAAEPFGEVLEPLRFERPQRPVYANTTGKPYPVAAAEAKELLARQLARPVRFVDTIENLSRDGVHTFVEVGPGARLTGMVRAILDGRAHHAVATDASQGKKSGLHDLAVALGQIAALGHRVALDRWDPRAPRIETPSAKRRFTVPLTGANYRRPVEPRPPVSPAPATRSAVSPPPVTRSSVADGPETPAPVSNPEKPLTERAPTVPAPKVEREIGMAPSPSQPAPSAPESAPSIAPAAPSTPSPELARHLVDHIQRLQELQAQTAEIHAQFLAGQHAAHESFARLIESTLAGSAASAPLAPRVAPRAPSAPTVPATPAPAPESTPISSAPSRPETLPVEDAPTAEPIHPRLDAASPAPGASPTSRLEPTPSNDDATVETVLSIVAEKTGYPREVIELDMNLEADLGIDSIKRVEILAAAQDRMPGATSVGAEELGRLTTLREVVQRLGSSGTVAVESATATAVEIEDVPPAIRARTAAPTDAPPSVDWEAILFRVVAEKTGYPVEILSREMHLEADLGIDSIKRVEILSALTEERPELGVLSPEVLARLATLSDVLAEVDREVGATTITPTVEPASSRAEPTTAIATDDATLDATPSSPGIDPKLLLEIVSDKTGYPPELIDLDMELEADLGIDSIKRVEILSAFQEAAPGAATFSSERLGQLRTLREVLAEAANGSETIASVAPRPAPEAASHDVPTPASAVDDIANEVIEIVADKTGYPVEALDLALELEADLGIDSIKRVEILSALQDRFPSLPAVGADEASTLRSLGQLVERLGAASSDDDDTPDDPPPATTRREALERSAGATTPDARTAPTVESLPDEPPSTRLAAQVYPASLSRQVVRLRTVPAHEELGPSLGHGSGEVWVVGAPGDARDAIARAFAARGLQVRHYAAEAPPRRTKARKLVGCVLIGTDALTPAAALAWSQRAHHEFSRQKTERPFFASVSTLDGAFGFAGLTARRSVRSAALAGLIKTARREWTEVSCRAFDLDPEERLLTDAQRARSWVDECLRRGPAELGFRGGERVALELVEADPEVGTDSRPDFSRDVLSRDDVILVTGGARGVTAAVARGLAERYQPTLVLWGRSELPEREPNEWAGHDEAGLKQALFARYGQSRKPREIQDEVASILRNREIREQLDRLRAAGARVVYRSVDVRDRLAVRSALATVRRDHGEVTGIVHGAGVLRDRHLAELGPEELDAVYSTKVDALETLLAEIANPKLLVTFSSTTARLGRVGQAAYAMANEVLNKLTARERVRRPGCRALAMNWGPWDGGMVTPALRKLFESEGVGLIPLVDGSDALLHEIAHADTDTEIVVLGRSTPRASGPVAPTTKGSATEPAASDFRDVASWTLDPSRQEFLDHHRLAGRCVLPIALMVEWISEAALHAQPGYRLLAVEDFQLLQGLKLDDTSVELRGAVSRPEAGEAGACRVQVELRTTVAHARASVRLGPPSGPGQRRLELPSGRSVSPATAYRDLLFHGPAWQVIDRIESLSKDGLEAIASTRVQPSDWLDRPRRRQWVTQPLALDAAFQLLIVWTQTELRVPSLPCAFGRLELFTHNWPSTGARIVARVKEARAGLVRADLEFLDSSGGLLARMDDYRSATSGDLAEAFRAR